MNYQFLMREELGRRFMEPDLFRVGASSLLADIERQLEHHLTGSYSAYNRHAIGEHPSPERERGRGRV